MKTKETVEEVVEKESISNFIEHTNLKPDATKDDILKLCEEAIKYNMYGVCVSPYYVQFAKKAIKKSPVKLISVVGFPLGYATTSSKVEETKKAIMSGADEIDMVINLSALKNDDKATLQNDIQAVVTACHLQNKICKIIIETAYLSKEEIETACMICTDAGADFVKTSTGYAPRGASVEDIKLLRAILPKKIRLKASGGIKDLSFAQQLIDAGADRIGTSHGVSILETNE